MRILVLHNLEFCRTTLKTLLEAWGYEVVLAGDGREAQAILDGEDPPQLAILDVKMPGLNGYELCQRIREQKNTYVYVIMVGADDQQSSVLRAYECGADDFIRRQPFDDFELKLRLRVAERILRRQQDLMDAREALKFEASHDPLVRLWNRKAILNLLTIELSRTKRQHSMLSVFFADLDHFKTVNDRYGHLVGDEVLRNAAIRMSAELREYDHFGRYGGEEFLAVLPNCSAETAREVAERVRLSIADRPLLSNPARVDVTVSIGVSQWRPGQELPEMLERADVALYRAKDRGRNRVEMEDGGAIATASMLTFASQTEQAGPVEVGRTANESKNAPSWQKVRQMRRAGLDRRLQIVTVHQGKPSLVYGRIRNISEHGLGAVIPRCLAIDEKVTLNFLMDDGIECTIFATVRHCHGLHCGFEFISVEPTLREAIARVCGAQEPGNGSRRK
jgi:two-component system cell cycle response regulator